uniref:regulatory protein RecX n=1 Tax=Erigeron canadensis TaxID=72917 RepID=UPI001CB8FE52|nr:regulatory protein RecX [Erigeron canadensis]
MAIFAGKLIYCPVLKPWASRKIIVRCCSNLGENSCVNVPVRYIPKKLSNANNKPNDFTPVPNDSKRRFIKHNSSNVKFRKVKEKSPDNDFKSGTFRSKETEIRNSVMRSEVGEYDYNWRSKPKDELNEIDTMEGYEEPIDDELDFQNGNYEIKHLVVESSKSKEAEMVAVGLLAKRTYTALELKKKLLGNKFSLEVSNAVISDFQNRGLINDLLYAEAFSRSRWSSSSWGPLKIKQALTKKGVNDLDAQKAIKSVLENDEPDDDDQVSRFGLSKPSMDHLFSQACKQWLRAKDLPSEKQKSRIIAWLRYRGFNWGIVSFILKKLQSEHPP